MKKNEFIPTIAPIVQAENKKRGFPLFSSVVIAQAICESGWGQSTIMMKANAIFGIKATSSWKGKVYNANTKECYDGVSMTNINACFRAYNNLAESISDYFNLITGSSRYKKALNCANYEACITAIKNGGYATDPNYINKIISIIKENNLTKYDVVETVENKAEKPKETATTHIKAKEPARAFNNSLAGTYKVTANSGLNVRNGAGLSKDILIAIPKGTKVKNYGYYTTVSGIKWLYIQFTYNNITYTGFATSQYLSK